MQDYKKTMINLVIKSPLDMRKAWNLFVGEKKMGIQNYVAMMEELETSHVVYREYRDDSGFICLEHRSS